MKVHRSPSPLEINNVSSTFLEKRSFTSSCIAYIVNLVVILRYKPYGTHNMLKGGTEFPSVREGAMNFPLELSPWSLGYNLKRINF